MACVQLPFEREIHWIAGLTLHVADREALHMERVLLRTRICIWHAD